MSRSLFPTAIFWFTRAMRRFAELNPKLKIFSRGFHHLPHKHKIFVAGNHDWLYETNNRFARLLTANFNIKYLQDSSVEIEGLKIYGSPWQPRFFDWAFNLMRGAELAEKWKLIPDDTDILITHGPPNGILDEVPRKYWIENTGCEELEKRSKNFQKKSETSHFRTYSLRLRADGKIRREICQCFELRWKLSADTTAHCFGNLTFELERKSVPLAMSAKRE